MDDYIPGNIPELIELLERVFPDKCADLNDSERHIFYKAGQHNVVTWLKDLKRRTEEQQLNSMMEK